MASFTPVIYVIGQTPVLILASHGKRTSYNIVFPATSKVSGNTGNVWIGIDIVPNATAGNSGSGHMMANGEQFGEASTYPGDRISQGSIYAVASAASQTIEVYEVTSA